MLHYICSTRIFARCAIAAGLLCVLNARAQTILIDLTQTVGTEIAGSRPAHDMIGDTYRWGGLGSDYNWGFDLEFGSRNAMTAVDLDGGNKAAFEWYQPGQSGFAYGLIQATYAGGDLWSISGKRDGLGSWVLIGTVQEFTGTQSHVANYGYGELFAESSVINGPADSKQSSTAVFKSCFWLYRDPTNTVSLNLTAGTANNVGNDGEGEMRGKVTFSVPVQVLVKNSESGDVNDDQIRPVLGVPNAFAFDFGWNSLHDDGFVIGSISTVSPDPTIPPTNPTAVPEPSTYASLGAALLMFVAFYRRFSR